MSAVYNTATVCPFNDTHCEPTARLTLDPQITERFAVSRDFDELEHLWIEWHDNTGPFMRKDYAQYVQLMKKVAVGNGFKDAAAYWQKDFEDERFEENVDKLWNDVKPLYDDLYTYMRYKLIEIYGEYALCTRPLL